MIYLISYDLNSPGKDYTGLHNAIKTVGAWWHHLDSTWLVDTMMPPADIYNILSPHIDRNDHLLIVQIVRNYWGYLPQDAWDWMAARAY